MTKKGNEVTTKDKAQSRDPRVKARILIDAENENDRIVAERYGVSERSIQRWRSEIATDPELARTYRRLMEEVEDGFIADAAKAFRALARRITELAPKMDAHEATTAMERTGDLLVQARALGRAGESGDNEPADNREGAEVEPDRPVPGTLPVH